MIDQAAISLRRSWRDRASLPDRLRPWIESLTVRLAASSDGPIFSVGIAACSAGDGATTIAMAVAHHIQSGLGKRALLVDADTRGGRLDRAYRLPRAPGFTDLLAGRASLREVVRATDDGGLHVMTAGTPLPNALGLLEGHVLDTMMTRLREAFELVIFDCAPLDLAAETFVLAKRLDGLVMVLAAERTRWENGARQIERLRNEKVRVLGAALNGKRFFIPSFLYRRL
jgi:capsular exopolysaccharide synthesis family protein